jgi:hypothetical protein
MKTKLLASVLLLSGMTAFATTAMASDSAAGALIGAGTGAIIGNSIDRHDGAVVGGILGAMLGAAIADDDDRGYRGDRYYSRTYYGPPPVVFYDAPRTRYLPPPFFVEHRPMPYAWRHERYEYRDGGWDRDHDRGHDDRGGRWDRDHDRGHDDHDGRRGW